MRRNRQKEKTPDASGHMAAAPGVCCYLFVLVCEIEFLAVIVRIRHTFQLGRGLLGQRPHIPVHTRHGCGDLAYRPASVCVVVHTGIERSGVKRIRLHDLRHSHASMLVDMGVAPLEIAERLGHEKVETTLNTYSHLYPSTQSKLAGLLDKKHEEEEE